MKFELGRTKFLIFGQILLFLAFLLRLAFLAHHYQYYENLARSNNLRKRFFPAERGLILSRDGQILARDNKIYQAVLFYDNLIPEELVEIKTQLKFLNISKFPENANPKYFTILKEDLSWREIELLEFLNLPKIRIMTGYKRCYPLAKSAAFVTGSVNFSNYDRNISRFFTAKKGVSGLEKTFNSTLEGKNGKIIVEVDAKNKLWELKNTFLPQRGQDLTLTIDSRLQNFFYEQIKPLKAGIGIVINNKTGEVLAFVSCPSFDPNSNYSEDLSLKPFLNRLVNSVYPPGSIFKIVIALAGLYYNMVPKTVVCDGQKIIGNRSFRCHKDSGHGFMTLEKALACSCNVFFYTLALDLGIEKILTVARKLGFGESFNWDLGATRSGFLPFPEWKMKKFKQKWFPADTAQIGIGQGFLSVTPIQLACMLFKIIKRDFNATPWLSVKPNLLIDSIPEELVQRILTGLFLAINSDFGTARGLQYGLTKIIGKTSTAQVKSISLQERMSGAHRLRAWEYRDNAYFISAGPWPSLDYTILIMIEHGVSSRVPGQIAQNIFDFLNKNNFVF